jgi:radical SAM protein with 4Fe4S-binding SPASM domain
MLEYGREQCIREPLSNFLRVSRNDTFICSNGAVTLCDAAYNGEIDLGNVNHSTLLDIWNGKKREKVLALNRAGQVHKMEFCRKCTDYDI